MAQRVTSILFFWRWSYATKVYFAAAGFTVAIAASILGVWAYSTIEEIEDSRLIDCARVHSAVTDEQTINECARDHVDAEDWLEFLR